MDCNLAVEEDETRNYLPEIFTADIAFLVAHSLNIIKFWVPADQEAWRKKLKVVGIFMFACRHDVAMNSF